MNQMLEKSRYAGNVLDIGGGEKSNYKSFLKCDKYISINIDKKIRPDYLVKVNQKFPLKGIYFDKCLLFNVLEHIFDWNFLFTEISKVLKNKGEIHIIIPFLYPIHGAPNDYKRVTKDYLIEFLTSYSFTNIKVIPLSFGPFTNSQLIGYRHKSVNQPISQIAVTLDIIFHKLFKSKYLKYNQTCPLFYYCKANLDL